MGLVGSLQAPNVCLLLCLSWSISLNFFLRQSPPNLFPLRSLLGAGYGRVVDTRIIGRGSCHHSTRNHRRAPTAHRRNAGTHVDYLCHYLHPIDGSSNQENPGFRVFTHFGSAEDPVITNNAEEKPKQNPATSWVFLVTGWKRFTLLSWQRCCMN